MGDNISPHQLKPVAQKKEIFLSGFFLAPSMEVPRLAAISYKRHLMNRLKHSEGIPSSALTLQGIYGSIHYSDFVGTEEVSTIIQGHAVTTKVGLCELTSCIKSWPIYKGPQIFILRCLVCSSRYIYIPLFWSLTASCRLQIDTVSGKVFNTYQKT